MIAKTVQRAALAAVAVTMSAAGLPSAWDAKMAQLSVTGNCIPYQVLYHQETTNCSGGQCDYVLQVITPKRKVHIVITLSQPPAHWTLLAGSLQASYTNENVQYYPLLRVPTAGPAPPFPVSVTLFCPFG
ncbi:MAG TPA: hypothetical protein VG651_16045 [Stellaceae bacterium]|nr:hypothetical protein [Stellaceae bacterium]